MKVVHNLGQLTTVVGLLGPKRVGVQEGTRNVVDSFRPTPSGQRVFVHSSILTPPTFNRWQVAGRRGRACPNLDGHAAPDFLDWRA